MNEEDFENKIHDIAESTDHDLVPHVAVEDAVANDTESTKKKKLEKKLSPVREQAAREEAEDGQSLIAQIEGEESALTTNNEVANNEDNALLNMSKSDDEDQQ